MRKIEIEYFGNENRQSIIYWTHITDYPINNVGFCFCFCGLTAEKLGYWRSINFFVYILYYNSKYRYIEWDNRFRRLFFINFLFLLKNFLRKKQNRTRKCLFYCFFFSSSLLTNIYCESFGRSSGKIFHFQLNNNQW